MINGSISHAERGLPPSQSMVRNFAKEITGNKPDDRTALSQDLMMCLSYDRKKIEEYEIEPRNMYNMNEKAFLIGALSKGQRIFSQRWYQKGEPQQRIQDGNREWITTIACICADETALSPGLIYQAVSRDMQDTWLQDFKPDDHHYLFPSSPSGWTKDELGYAWLITLFDPEKEKREGARALATSNS
ncbi:conserved hypothetical protein [Talaromyces stipitatus ATCC 10500]|uniref:DDE-1 domain-containing protein n=1 Tax=Talaromyces stipitatus (strain ATCC 10500 / CBS 375.48 / QM 6759 / NRRL 1006) TaxID=441959 RepID=B8MV79_TALSN|nr:uncharacterized protein TSTA_008310 [Talaromyces stipitatus ATCC 10500]EED11535.1 conserved hypothetical protein [Talaromyces stipitatus ATCC 10500]